MLARIRKAMEEKDEGFTLIELLVVIIIIGILAAIAIPVYLNQRNKGYDAAAKSDAKALANLEEAWLTDNTGYTGMIGTGGITDFKKTDGVKTGVAVAAAPNDAKGFCIISKSKSGKYFVFDSQDGGLKATGYDTYALAAAGATGPSCTAAKPADADIT